MYAITFVAPTPGELLCACPMTSPPLPSFEGDVFVLIQPTPTVATVITLLGYNGCLSYTSQSDGVHITFPVDISFGTLSYAWTIKLTNVN